MQTSVTDWIGACCAIVTTFVAIFAALYARRQWIEAKGARHDAAAGEVERLQASVAVYLEPMEADGAHTFLVVKNFGPTTATDVVVTLTEPIRRPIENHPFETVAVPAVFPVFPPGYEWRTWVARTAGRAESGLPVRYDGEVEYVGFNGELRKHAVVLDIAALQARVYPMETRTADVVKAIDKISDTIKSSAHSRPGP